MAQNSLIEWTDATWNPVRGCTKVSAGCEFCYAMGVAARFSGPGLPYEGLAKRVGGKPQWTNMVRLLPEKLDEPLHWREPRRIFVNSMSDLFHDAVPDDFIDQVFAVMALCPQHTFQILTKRPERMHAYVNNVTEKGALLRYARQEEIEWPLPNAWLGVSVEDQATADERIPHLLRTPAAVRFISYEPALGPVDFSPYLRRRICSQCGQKWSARACGPTHALLAHDAGLHWVIVGGESGPHARPMHPDWARTARDQCQAAGVAFFFKQHGEYLYSYQCGGRLSELTYPKNSVYTHHQFPDGTYVWRVGKKQAGRLLDGREWSEYPEVQP